MSNKNTLKREKNLQVLKYHPEDKAVKSEVKRIWKKIDISLNTSV